MLLKKLRWFLGGLVLLSALAVFFWGIWPAHQNKLVFALPGANLELSKVTPSILTGKYQLHINWPDRVHAGSVNRISLQIDPVDRTASKPPGVSIAGRPPVVESRLGMAGVRFVPGGEISQALTSGKPLQYSWQIRTQQDGVYPGMIWLHLNVTTDETGSSGKRILLLSQPIEIQSTKLFGLDAYLAQVVGIIGIIVGAALCFDLISRVCIKFWRKVIGDRSKSHLDK